MMKYNSLADFLSASGVLEIGDPSKIEAVKREYRRLYLRQYKKDRRGNKREITLSLPKNYYRKLHIEGERHGLSVQRLIINITEAYLKKVPVVHHPEQFGKLEILIAQLHSELIFIGDQMLHEIVSPDIQRIQSKVEELEKYVRQASHSINLEQYLLDLNDLGILDKHSLLTILNRILDK